MIFNDGSLLDFGRTAYGIDDAIRFDVGEVIITGRMPGALYVDDISDGQTLLEYALPHEFSNNLILDPTDFGGVSVDADVRVDAPVVDNGGDNDAGAGAALVAANDDDGPAAMVAQSHGKDEAPLVLVPSVDDGHLNLVPVDLHELSLPRVPLLETGDAPTVTVTAPTFDGEPSPVIIGGRAYQSLSFLIIDTPFAVGDSHLPENLRPPINDLLGLTDDDDANAWVLPVANGHGAWLLG